ncbi:hypothetical protein J3U35_05570, partial [Gilliamella sp. B2717]|uniref:hypothetical protein n=1 Tax=Gilliamella sp. B2717 TaxID=2817996 RepID=UPI002269C5C7
MKSETRKKLKMGYNHADMTLKEVQKDYTQESVSDNPRPIGPYYAYNDRYLEIRGGMFENFRGILTWICFLIFLLPSICAYVCIVMILDLYNNLITNVGGAIFTKIFNFIIFSILIYLCIRYFRYIY